MKPTSSFWNYGRGIALVLLLSILSLLALQFSFIQKLHISPLIIGVLLGIALSFVVAKTATKPHLACEKGIHFSAKTLLRLGIVLYGFNVSLADMQSVGIVGVLSSLFIVCAILALGIVVGLVYFKMDRDLVILVSSGSAICGAAAILAIETSLHSESYKGIVAVATVVIFGLLGMFLFPLLYALDLMPFSPLQEGLFLGLTLHEVANVVGAASAISPDCATIAVIIKMIRVILLVPVLFLLPLFLRQKNLQDKQGTKVKKASAVPWFALWFLVMIIVHSIVPIPQPILEILQFCCVLCLTMAMCALGLQMNIAQFRHCGAQAFGLGLILFIALGVGGFLLVWGLSSAQMLGFD
ncbi:MAG: putative sulfate exporter family transporter [Helicobacter sp.]|nr:putative sulfate exporter family transporter [Helicobacter sp.]